MLNLRRRKTCEYIVIARRPFVSAVPLASETQVSLHSPVLASTPAQAMTPLSYDDYRRGEDEGEKLSYTLFAILKAKHVKARKLLVSVTGQGLEASCLVRLADDHAALELAETLRRMLKTKA